MTFKRGERQGDIQKQAGRGKGKKEDRIEEKGRIERLERLGESVGKIWHEENALKGERKKKRNEGKTKLKQNLE